MPSGEVFSGQDAECDRIPFDLSPEAHFISQDGRLVYANAEGLSLVGAADMAQLASGRLADYLGQEGGERAQHRYARIAAGQVLDQTRYSLRALDGRVTEVGVRSVGITYRGKPALLSVARDVAGEARDAEHIERRLRELSALHGLAETINRSDTLEQVYPEALRALRDTARTDRSAILLFDERNVMRFVAWDGLSEKYRVAVEGHSPWAAGEEHARPLLVSRLEAEPSLAGLLPVISAERIASLAFIPIAHRGRLFGKFMLYYDAPHEFSAEETRLALTVAEQLALTVSRQRASDEVLRLNAELEERVRRRTAQLDIAQREMEAFCYSVSHDLRAPLRALDGFARILMEDADHVLEEKDKDNLRRIVAASGRMGRLMDDLLRLSRIGRSGMRLTRLDLSALAGEIADRLRTQAPERNVEVSIAPEMANEADAALMRIALEHLLGNAWKYTRRAAQAHIEFGAEEQGGRTCYFMRDNGAGFDMRYAGKLFSPFHRAHSPAEFEGNGIGLAIVARIAQRHGGRAWAESEPGRGTTIRFTLWEEAIPSELKAQPVSFRTASPPA